MEVGAPTGTGRLDAIAEMALNADSLSFSVARTTSDLVQSYNLVYKNYLRAGYIDPHSSEMRYSSHNAIPSTATFAARLEEAVVTTASVVFDSPLGLPMDAIYREELDALRGQGARLCEVTMLADRRRAGMRTIPSILQLFRQILRYTVRFEKATDIVISINPTHAAFYSRYLRFEDLGGLKHYPSVKNAPAVAKRVNLAGLEDPTKWQRLREFFMDYAPDDAIFADRKRFTADELREFFVIRRCLLPNLPKATLAWVRSQYTDYDFEAILAPAQK